MLGEPQGTGQEWDYALRVCEHKRCSRCARVQHIAFKGLWRRTSPSITEQASRFTNSVPSELWNEIGSPDPLCILGSSFIYCYLLVPLNVVQIHTSPLRPYTRTESYNMRCLHKSFITIKVNDRNHAQEKWSASAWNDLQLNPLQRQSAIFANHSHIQCMRASGLQSGAQ